MATSKQPSSRKPGQASSSRSSQAGATQAAVAQSNGPTVDQIQMRAFEIYIASGRPEGMSAEHWAQAEAELRGTP